MPYVYILKSSKNNSYYIGSCNDIQKRLADHNAGLVRSTKSYLPWELMYTEEYPSTLTARKRESQIKSWKKRLAIERLIKRR